MLAVGACAYGCGSSEGGEGDDATSSDATTTPLDPPAVIACSSLDQALTALEQGRPAHPEPGAPEPFLILVSQAVADGATSRHAEFRDHLDAIASAGAASDAQLEQRVIAAAAWCEDAPRPS